MCIIGLSVWDEFGENGIENSFENKILRAKEKSEFPTCQSGTTMRPCGGRACKFNIGWHDRATLWHDRASLPVRGIVEFSLP